MSMKTNTLFLLLAMAVAMFQVSCFNFPLTYELTPGFEVLYDVQGNVLEPLWITELHTETGAPTKNYFPPMLHNQTLVTPARWSSPSVWNFLGLDLQTGEVIWTSKGTSTSWSFLTHDIGNLQSKEYFISYNSAGAFAFDFNSQGSLVWRENPTDLQSYPEHPFVKDGFFYTGLLTDTMYKSVFYKVDVLTAQKEELFTLPVDTIHKSRLDWGVNDHLLFSVHEVEGEEFLFVPFYEIVDDKENLVLTLHVGCYNISKKEWVYSKETLRENMNDKYYYNFDRPILYKDQLSIFNFGCEMIAVDLFSGKEIWTYSLPDYCQYRSILVDEVLVVAPTGSYNESYKVFGLAASSGELLWEQDVLGAASSMNHLNGVIYWKATSSVSKVFLYAMDITSGQVYWEIGTPEFGYSSKEWLSIGVAVSPGINGEKGKVFSSSYNHMYCLEAVR